MNYSLGIDVAKAKRAVTLRLPNGKIRSKGVKNGLEGFLALSAWLSKQRVDRLHVCMEAAHTYWEAVAEFLADTAHTVSVVNPAQIKAFGAAALTRTKSDRQAWRRSLPKRWNNVHLACSQYYNQPLRLKYQ